MIASIVNTNSILKLLYFVVYMLSLTLVSQPTFAQTLELSGGFQKQLYGRLSVAADEKPELLPTSDYKKYNYTAAKFMDGVALFMVGEQTGEYFFKTSEPSDKKRFPIIFKIKSGLNVEIKLYWVNLTATIATVDSVKSLRVTDENYQNQLRNISGKGEIFEKLLADLTFKINELEADNSISQNNSATTQTTQGNITRPDVEQASLDEVTENVNSGKDIRMSEVVPKQPEQEIASFVSETNELSHSLQFLLANQELLNANMMLRMLAFLSFGISLILLYFALVVKLSRSSDDQGNAISQELQKRDIFESTILLRERNLYDRALQISQQTITGQQHSVAPAQDPKEILREMLEEYMQPMQVKQTSITDNVNDAMGPKLKETQIYEQVSQNSERAYKPDESSEVKTKQQSSYVASNKQRENDNLIQKSDVPQAFDGPEDEVKKLQVATIYYNMGDIPMAVSLLKELQNSSFEKIKTEAIALLQEIDK